MIKLYSFIILFAVGCSFEDSEVREELQKTKQSLIAKDKELTEKNNEIFSVRNTCDHFKDEDLKKSIADKQVILQDLESKIPTLKSDFENTSKLLASSKAELEEVKKESLYCKTGKHKRFILNLELRQSRIMPSLKDYMNKTNFELPVDEEFYNQVNIGSELVDDFRAGSLILSGSFSSWKVKVIGKRTDG